MDAYQILEGRVVTLEHAIHQLQLVQARSGRISWQNLSVWLGLVIMVVGGAWTFVTHEQAEREKLFEAHLHPITRDIQMISSQTQQILAVGYQNVQRIEMIDERLTRVEEAMSARNLYPSRHLENP